MPAAAGRADVTAALEARVPLASNVCQCHKPVCATGKQSLPMLWRRGLPLARTVASIPSPGSPAPGLYPAAVLGAGAAMT